MSTALSNVARTTFGLLAAGSIALTASPAMAAPASDKGLCKSGGFADYVDPATGAPFTSQGRCVSYVNGGGVLAPVVVSPPASPESLTLEARVDSAPYCRIYFELAGFEPNTTVTGTYTWQGDVRDWRQDVDADGAAANQIGGWYNPGESVTVTAGGQSATTTCPAV